MHEIQLEETKTYALNKNTTKERKKTDAGVGVQMSKALNHNSLALRDNKLSCRRH